MPGSADCSGHSDANYYSVAREMERRITTDPDYSDFQGVAENTAHHARAQGFARRHGAFAKPRFSLSSDTSPRRDAPEV